MHPCMHARCYTSTYQDGGGGVHAVTGRHEIGAGLEGVEEAGHLLLADVAWAGFGVDGLWGWGVCESSDSAINRVVIWLFVLFY